jgi:hypothetical protein
LSRNKNRVGANQPDISSPPQHVMQNNSNESDGFSFVVPTEFVDLPSGGRYYPEGHPLCGEECIEIKQMTAKEEDILSSRTLLKKGIALDRVIESLIVNKSVDPQSLLIGDRNAIIIATRVSGYGNEYMTGVVCPNCGHNQKYTFDLNDSAVYHGDDVHTLEVSDHEDGTFSVVLPRTQATIQFRLLTGRDEKALLENAEAARKRRAPERSITTQLCNMIVSVNGDDDRKLIMHAVENIPSLDSRHLRMAYKLAAPNIDLSQHFECEECSHEEIMEVPLTADFFWPDR